MAGIKKGTKKKGNPDYVAVTRKDKNGKQRTIYVKKGVHRDSDATGAIKGSSVLPATSVDNDVFDEDVYVEQLEQDVDKHLKKYGLDRFEGMMIDSGVSFRNTNERKSDLDYDQFKDEVLSNAKLMYDPDDDNMDAMEAIDGWEAVFDLRGHDTFENMAVQDKLWRYAGVRDSCVISIPVDSYDVEDEEVQQMIDKFYEEGRAVTDEEVAEFKRNFVVEATADIDLDEIAENVEETYDSDDNYGMSWESAAEGITNREDFETFAAEHIDNYVVEYYDGSYDIDQEALIADWVSSGNEISYYR